MKRKLYCLLLLFALVFAVGCNKDDKQTSPTPEPTATSTPIPENLAKTNLDKLPAQFDAMMSSQPETNVDFSKGAGYDVSLEVSLGDDIVELLGLDGLESISASGTVDIKDSVAANLGLFLNTSEVITANVFADDKNLMFNLPKYSTNYAAASWEELMEAGDVEFSMTGSAQELPTNEEITTMFRTFVTDLVNCFQKVDGITKDVTIGTGDYTMTGEKHTVSASVDALVKVLEAFEAELSKYAEVNFDLEDMKSSEAKTFFLEYYVNDKGDYAWACYPDTATNEPFVFINTALGFCLYSVEEDSSITIGMTSVKETEKSGVVTLVFDNEEPMGTIEYEYDDNSFAFDAVLDTVELSMECTNKNGTVTYDVTLESDGVSLVLNETVSKDHVDATCTLASFGMEYVTVSITADVRDYAEISAPQNTTDIETWANSLDLDTLLNDLLQLMEDYPFLIELMGMSTPDVDYGDDYGDDDTRGDGGTFEIPQGYTDDFMGLTGYAVDEDGYVDFDPLEEEVLAAGKPSTGFDTLAVTDDQIQAMFGIAEKAIANCETDIDSYFWVWGSIEYDDVRSYYSTDYEFSDPNSWDNSIDFTFDAVSGEFASVSIYNESKDEALRIANEIFAVLGGTYTITAELVEDYTYDDESGFSFSGYDASKYGSNYYNVEISIFYPDWDW